MEMELYLGDTGYFHMDSVNNESIKLQSILRENTNRLVIWIVVRMKE